MKKLLLPLIVAVLAGLTSASAATFVNAKKTAKVHAAHVADSVLKHVTDSTAVADSVEKVRKAHEAEKAAEALLMTPADSIRAAQNQPTTLNAATKGLPNAADPKHGVAEAHSAPVPTGHDVVAPTKNAPGLTLTPKGKIIVPRAVDAIKPAPVAAPTHAAPAATATVPENAGLPESRFAKIFSTMASKDAAKILEQMNDSDVRFILSKVSDKQAAAILVAFPATRAAAISRAESRAETAKPATKTDSSKSQKSAGEHK